MSAFTMPPARETELDLRFKTPFDRRSVPFYAASAAAHLLLLLVIMSFPDRASTLELDGLTMQDKFVQLAVSPEQRVEEPRPNRDGADAAGAAAHDGDEGEAGAEDAPVSNKKLAIKGPAENEDVEIRRERDLEIATNAGIAGELMVSSPWGGSERSVGSDALHALGKLDGEGHGASKGFGGLGIRGEMRGGGGDVEGSLGIDRIGTKGRDTGYGVGAANVDPGEHKPDTPPEVFRGDPVIDGGLDREIIQRVVRQHRRGIKACYEAELTRDRTLAGEVKVKFTVAPTGRVISAIVDRTSLKNAAVESCMTSRIRRWIFPEPKGGQMVIVKYPFRFSAGG